MTRVETTVRRHDLTGTYNLRDTGGYPAPEGATRWGKLYRSDALHQLTDDSRERFAALGITLVIDLRDDHELSSSPSRLDGLGVSTVHAPIFAGAAPAATLDDVTLDSLYRLMIAEHGVALTDAVRHIARSGEESVLVHCTAGKDRTGLVVALALSAVGVERAAVVADYAATEDNLRGEWASAMLERMLAHGYPASPDLVQIISASPPALIADILDRIDTEHGSAAEYLVANGLDRADLELLRTALIDTATPSSEASTPVPEKVSTP